MRWDAVSELSAVAGQLMKLKILIHYQYHLYLISSLLTGYAGHYDQ